VTEPKAVAERIEDGATTVVAKTPQTTAAARRPIRLLDVLSGEVVLRSRPNGGGVVLYRSLQSALLVYLAAIGVREIIAPNHLWSFDLQVARAAIANSLPWFGAIFAATYAGFYTRFSQQWTYLAGLYNQIMQTDAQIASKTADQLRLLAAWKAGFIEDAEDLHLAEKPMYAAVIISFLKDEGVHELYVQNTVGGEARLADLKKRAKRVLEQQ
jgi:hypothetical protein